MATIISKRHKLKFYLTIIVGTLFFVTMGTAMLLMHSKISNHRALKAKDNLMPFLAIAIYGIAIYTIYKYYKNAPIIEVDNTSISIDHETFDWTDLKSIELTGKRPFPYLINFPMEAATLEFSNGRKKYIFDDMYENSWEIKSFLKKVVIDKEELSEEVFQPIDLTETDGEYFETFNGSQITSFRGITLWGLIGFLAYVIVTVKRKPAFGLIVFFILYSFFWFLLFSWMMHYFKTSGRHFVVKNQNLFWRTKVYRLADIDEIVFETRQKMPNCLRVITKDFRSKLYPAATLRNKTWLALKDNLESYHIKVRNECI